MRLLLKDGRASVTELARSVGRSESAVRERIASLERDGVIQGYRAVISPERVGYGVRALLRAKCDRRHVHQIADRLQKIPWVTEAYVTTGPRPIVAEIVAEDVLQLEEVMERRLAALPLEDLETDLVVRPLVANRLVVPPPRWLPTAMPSDRAPGEGNQAPVHLPENGRRPEVAHPVQRNP